jgi:hypothetical protein
MVREAESSPTGGEKKAQTAHAGESTEGLPQTGQDAAQGGPHDKGIECNNDQEPQTQDQGYEKTRHFGTHSG